MPAAGIVILEGGKCQKKCKNKIDRGIEDQIARRTDRHKLTHTQIIRLAR